MHKQASTLHKNYNYINSDQDVNQLNYEKSRT